MDVVAAALDRLSGIRDRVTYLEACIPQGIEEVPQCGFRYLGVGPSARPQEEEVDIGMRRELAASVASDRNDRYSGVIAQCRGRKVMQRAVDIDRALPCCSCAVGETFRFRYT
jgi:hypothetical protein